MAFYVFFEGHLQLQSIFDSIWQMVRWKTLPNKLRNSAGGEGWLVCCVEGPVLDGGGWAQHQSRVNWIEKAVNRCGFVGQA